MPQIFQTTQMSRPLYLDRNPIVSHTSFGQGVVAPHGTTTRATYTCPAGKKAWLDSIWLDMIRTTSPVASGNAFVRAWYTPNAGTQTIMLQVFQNSGALNIDLQAQTPQVGFIAPGDRVFLTTEDDSTGGAYDYNMSFKRTEFDA